MQIENACKAKLKILCTVYMPLSYVPNQLLGPGFNNGISPYMTTIKPMHFQGIKNHVDLGSCTPTI